MTDSLKLRIALVAPVAQAVPPTLSGSIETITALLSDELVTRGHDVTLFATENSITNAKLESRFPRGYNENSSLWPWELCELLNLSAAVESAAKFDVIHYQAEYAPIGLAFTRISPIPVVQTLHHAPSSAEVDLWSYYTDAPFIAISKAQSRLLTGLRVLAVIHHALDLNKFIFSPKPDNYLLFLGRFSDGKGVLEAIDVARRTNHRLILAAAENDYYREIVSPHVDQKQVFYAGEVGHEEKVKLLGGARALLYPLNVGEPFGLVMAEAMACGTPVAAIARGAVPEIVDDGLTGGVFNSLESLIAGLERVTSLSREQIRLRANDRFGVTRMVDAYIEVYRRLQQNNATRQR